MDSVTKQSLISCEECGLVVAIPEVKEGQKVQCPRCAHTLLQVIEKPFQRPVAYVIACIVMLTLSISFSFMSFSVEGFSQNIGLLDAVKMLDQFKNSALALLLLVTVIILPAIYLFVVLYLYFQSTRVSQISFQTMNHIRILCKLLFRVEPWLMVDVFLVGVLVSLVKIASLADIGLGNSFWAFCIYSLLLVKCVSLVNRSWLWSQFYPIEAIDGVRVGDTHLSNTHTVCHVCHQVNERITEAHESCIRCKSTLHDYDPQQNLHKVWALLITAAIFYIPANLYPIMYTVSLGNEAPSTIIGGVIMLWHHGSYPIAMIIFFASVFIPLIKMFALSWLFITTKKASRLSERSSLQWQKIYRLTEVIGRWSMIDIFVVAILVALVQLQNLMTIYPGPGALSFAAVVVFTMLSAMKFDSRMLWQTAKVEPINGKF